MTEETQFDREFAELARIEDAELYGAGSDLCQGKHPTLGVLCEREPHPADEDHHNRALGVSWHESTGAVSISGDLADEPPADDNVPDMRQVLSVAQLRELRAGILNVLSGVQDNGGDVGRQASFLTAWIAPQLATREFVARDERLRVRQLGAALTGVMAERERLVDLAHRRHEVAVRLREELEAALVDGERFRALTPQSCPAGLHDGWLVDSKHEHACPWCLINERTDEVDRLRAHIAECHRLQNNIAAVVGVETDWDAAGRQAVLDAVCRMSGNLADAPDDAPMSVLCDLLLVVGVTVTEEQVTGWTPAQRRDAERWAVAVHLSASDNPVEVPARPAFLRRLCPEHGTRVCANCERCVVDGAS